MGHVVELTKLASDMIDVLRANPKGMKIEDLAQAVGTSPGSAKLTFQRMRGLTTSVRGRRRGDTVWMQFKEVAPNVQVLLQQGAGKAAGPKKNGVAEVAGGTSGGVAKADGGDSTDLVFPSAPEIPDITDKYAWFIKPDYFDRMGKHLLVHRHNLRLAGPPGIGKSSAYEYAAAVNGNPLVNINAEAGLRWRDLVGKMTDLGRFEVAQFAAAVIFGWWAKIDEANAMDPDAAMALNSILAPPYQIIVHGKTYKVHPEFRLAVTYNPGLIGTKPLPDSLKDRLYPLSVPFPSEAILRKMLKSNGVDITLPTADNLIKFAMALAAAKEAKQIRYDITIRTMLHVWSDVMDGVPLNKAIEYGMLAGIDSLAEAMAVRTVMTNSSASWKS